MLIVLVFQMTTVCKAKWQDKTYNFNDTIPFVGFQSLMVVSLTVAYLNVMC